MEEPLDIFGVPTPNPQVMVTETAGFGEKNSTIVYSTVFPSIFVLTLLIVIRHIIRKRRRKNRRVLVASSIYLIPDLSSGLSKSSKGDKEMAKNTHIQKPHGASHFHRTPVYKNQEHPVYMVPFTALPTDFDFSSPMVQVCSDFVIVKDLDILQNCSIDTPASHPLEEYQKQTPYNPSFARNQVMVY